jgi:hypothetical protein
MKIFQVEAELFRADGRTDVHTDIRNLTAAFCNFSNAPKTIASHSMPESKQKPARLLLIVTRYATSTTAQFSYFYCRLSSYPGIFKSTENIYWEKVNFIIHVSKSQKFCSFLYAINNVNELLAVCSLNF